jgi:hypothetical protein
MITIVQKKLSWLKEKEKNDYNVRLDAKLLFFVIA